MFFVPTFHIRKRKYGNRTPSRTPNHPEERLAIPRAEVMAQLHAAGIGTGVHYPAIHRFAVYRRLGWKDGDCPIAERVCRNILTLPLFPAMTRTDVTRVVDALAGILQAHQKS